MVRFVTNALMTASEYAIRWGEIEIVWYVDGDDVESINTAQREIECGLPMKLVVGERIVLSECWNRCAAVASGDILGHMGDDIIFRTEDWDAMIESAFQEYEDRIVFVHGCDGIHDARLGTHGFLHRRWVDALGYFAPPYFAHDFNDTWFTEVADIIGRRKFLPDLLTEHMHPDVGKAEYDRTYREHAEAGMRDNVGALYESLRDVRIGDASKLRGVMV